MDHVRGILPSSRLMKGVFVLIGGAAGAQVIALLAAPLLTRLYQPEDFGVLGVYLALAAIVGVTAGLQYQSAIVLPDNEKEANAVFLLSVFLVLGTVGLVSVPVFLYPNDIAEMLNTPALADYLYLLPISVFFIGIYHSFNILAIREKAFTSIAQTRITQSFATIAIQLAGGQFGSASLVIGQVAGQALGTTSLVYRMLRRRWKRLLQVKLTTMLDVAYRYRRFPLFESWTGLFNVVGGQLPSILFAMLFGPAAAGMYALTTRVLFVPVQLLGQAASEVFCSRAADLNREGRLGTSTATIHARLTHIAIPPTLVMAISAPEIFALVFGPKWQEAGVFAQWLAPWLYLVLITSPLTMVFTVLGRQGTALIFELASLFGRAAAIIAGAYIGDVLTAVALLAGVSIISRASMLICLIRISGNPWRKIWQPPLSALLWSMLLVSPAIFSKVWSVDRTFWFLALGATAALILARYACLMKKSWA